MTADLAAAGAALARADLIIDGLLGIGGRGGLREPAAGLVRDAQRAADEAGATVVAVDLPSGIDADTGAVDGAAVRADVTVTFGAVKPGLLVDPGAGHAGTVELVDIGLGPYLPGDPAVLAPQHEDLARLLPRPGPESDKYRRGVVGVLAGSDRFAGAAVLATGGAVRGGAGMVRVVTGAGPGRGRAPGVARDGAHHLPRRPGLGPDRIGWAACRPGWPGRAWAPAPTRSPGSTAVLRSGVPVLVDADGLTIVSQHPGLLRREAPTLITPHAGELGRLLGADPAAIEARRLEHAQRAARELGVTVLLKGSTTVVASPDGGPVLVNPTGTSWLATAGTGDVLSGLAGALLAQGLAPAQAGARGRLPARPRRPAGRRRPRAVARRAGAARRESAGASEPGEAPIGAHDVITALPAAIRSVAAA